MAHPVQVLRAIGSVEKGFSKSAKVPMSFILAAALSIVTLCNFSIKT